MLIATYNINGINGRLPSLLEWLKKAAPDVVCLQELKAPDEKFPAITLRRIAACGLSLALGLCYGWTEAAGLAWVQRVPHTSQGEA
jgi:exonuclease III